MVRLTSVETYKNIKDSGLLSLRRWQVYEVLFSDGPLTGDVVSQKVKAKYGNWSQSETVRNRLTELRQLGCVYEVKETASPINGRWVILWDVTDRLPVKPVTKRRHKCRSCNGKGYYEDIQL